MLCYAMLCYALKGAASTADLGTAYKELKGMMAKRKITGAVLIAAIIILHAYPS